MSNASFQILFKGLSVETGAIDVKELAPALLSIGNLLEESNRVLNGERASISVKVKKFNTGSFGVSFEVVQKLTEQIISLFSGDTVSSALNIIETIGLTSTGAYTLFKLLKKARARKPQKAKKLENGNVELDFSDEKIEVPVKVFQLYRDLKVREEIENTLKPVTIDGIDSFEIQQDNQTIESLTHKELPCFKSPEFEDEKISEIKTTAVYSIQSLSFKDHNKWRLSDGNVSFFVTISDKEFLSKVDQNLISFSKGDCLTVNLLIKTWNTSGGLKTDYEAVKVIKHEKKAMQLTLPFEG